jgi:hypothetical protein
MPLILRWQFGSAAQKLLLVSTSDVNVAAGTAAAAAGHEDGAAR